MLAPRFPLRTERLLLRPYTDADAEFTHDLFSRPDVARYVDWPPRDREQARAVLQRRITQTRLDAEGGALSPLVELAATGEPVGEVQLQWTSATHLQGEIGYVIHPRHAGRGFATEAAAVMLRLGFAELGLHRIQAGLDRRNTASARVAEHLGMRREACLVHTKFVKDEWIDEVVYALLAEEWQQGR